MPVTLKQIAHRAGVSIPTVSYALNNKGHLLRPETLQRVLAAAQELGYRPNASARAMRSGKFNCVALLLSSVQGRSELPKDLLEGVHNALSARDMHLTVTQIPDEKLTSEGDIPKILRQSMADGLLINYTHEIPPQMLELINRHHIPSVWLNTKQDADCICSDDVRGAREATERLIALGHRRIDYLDYTRGSDELSTAHYSVHDRLAGYESAMRAAGLEPRIVRPPHRVDLKDRASFCLDWLKSGPAPTAVVVYYHAAPLVYAAAQMGLSVPRDLSVVTFGPSLSVAIGMAVDTMVIPESAMAQSAVEMLLEKIADPNRVLPCKQVALEFMPGVTTAGIV